MILYSHLLFEKKVISEPPFLKYGCQHEMSHCNRLKTNCCIGHQIETDLSLNTGSEIVIITAYRIANRLQE